METPTNIDRNTSQGNEGKEISIYYTHTPAHIIDAPAHAHTQGVYSLPALVALTPKTLGNLLAPSLPAACPAACPALFRIFKRYCGAKETRVIQRLSSRVCVQMRRQLNAACSLFARFRVHCTASRAGGAGLTNPTRYQLGAGFPARLNFSRNY